MRSPREAIAEIVERIAPVLERETSPLRRARGRVLAQEVLSDVDLPPFEKSAMDGFAVRAAELAGEGKTLRCVGESRAGQPFAGKSLPAGCCVAIYTGAELPADCDAVVMVEQTSREGDEVHFEGSATLSQNVNHRGEVLGLGRKVFAPGRCLSSVDLSVLAAVGCDPVPVLRRPKVRVLTTGDELVPASATPGRGQIREGNTLYLAAASERLGMEVTKVAIVPDDPGVLEEEFRAALEEDDALVTTGGVSMGKYDLVGDVLSKLGVEPVLHKVAIKPGKPIWFGMYGQKPVFGLPGNPVSSLLGFEVFVRPALLKLAGVVGEPLAERLLPGRWNGGATKPNWRQQNLPARIAPGEDGVTEVSPLAWMGSADIVALTEATAFAVVDPDESLQPGQRIFYRPLG